MYELSVSIGDFKVNLETDDVATSLLEINPVKVMQRVTFEIRQGDKSISQVLFPIRAKRIFFNRMAAEFFVKRLLLSIK